jgi:hypothetical protein
MSAAITGQSAARTQGPVGRQVVVDDPSGYTVEVFEAGRA